ncbi:phage tail sheath family protein [Sphingosinicella terrae]|uniref:phage tail sheath family protein n=1 Tax=Sphingosinicella terrae TaxID=2172047 RepID=UPI000E0D334A|nr:phage tail sheath subtilisin-like domain-containing protein [Sphingosinicella terrae]
MATLVTYPGVYVREESSGAQAVAAASTSTALFVGMLGQGPFEIPTRVLSLTEFQRVFGASAPGEMAAQVQQFYVNGGTEAWIMRIANGAAAASVVLRNQANNADSVRLTARDQGAAGNMIRAEVNYDTSSPERTFNLVVYRSSLRPDGSFERTDIESHANLSLDPGSSRYAPNIVDGTSNLVTLEHLNVPAAISGASIGGRIYAAAPAGAAQASVNALAPAGGAFMVSIGNRPPVRATFAAGDTPATMAANIVTAYGLIGMTVAATGTFEAFAGGRVLQFASPDGAVAITPAVVNDAATSLMLGTAAGGVEIDTTGPARPAPSGLSARIGTAAAEPAGIGWLNSLATFAGLNRSTVADFTLTDPTDPVPPPPNQATGITGTPGDPMHADAAVVAPAPVGSLANVRRALDELAASIAALRPDRWNARRVGVRLTLTPRFGGPNEGAGTTLATAATSIAASIFQAAAAQNVAAYSLGRLGGVAPIGKQTNAAPADVGDDGTEPLLADYQAAFGTIESVLDSFNLMVLPRAEGQTNAERRGLWGTASALAAKRRAILLVDPDDDWGSIAAAEAGVASLKIGVETRNAAVYWPRLRIPDAAVPAGRFVDPSGSIAGLMARTDSRFGVWTAPAGIEATIRGIVGIQRNMSDEENGVLNPKALNAIRLFPSGAVAWGARTMIGSDDTGNIDDKYIPVRRTMLFIEESLYRGLKFAVFRPNAEPLWASIRLAAGSFMNSLMRQGAFASRNKLEAYFVLCDATTTTATDQNLGIVNVVVGFAPLKPAEFVVLTVKQIAGQVEI